MQFGQSILICIHKEKSKTAWMKQVCFDDAAFCDIAHMVEKFSVSAGLFLFIYLFIFNPNLTWVHSD